MAENLKCDWCNNYGASHYSRTSNKKIQRSKQKFCSLKCKTEFEDRRDVEWIEEKKSNAIGIIILIIIVIYILSNSK
jgi:hypothetical protein